MEHKIVKALLESRDLYDRLRDHLRFDKDLYTREYKHVVERIDEYYKVDPTAKAVDVELLLDQVKQTLDNPKHYQMYENYINRAAKMETSSPNVAAMILDKRKYENRQKLAEALLSEEMDKVNVLMDDFHLLEDMTEDDATSAIQSHQKISLTDFFREREDPSSLIPVLPKALSEAIGGGLRRQHHVLIFGYTEVGKSAVAITMVAGFLQQGLKVAYLENEEAWSDTYARVVYATSDMDRFECRDNPELAEKRAKEKGLDNFVLLDSPSGTFREIEACVKEHKPDVLVINQIINLTTSEENEVLKLAIVSRFGRYLAKKYNMIVISVTQGGESCYLKRILEIPDLYYSKVGIQSQQDLMIGVGAGEEEMANHLRILSLCKNKLNNNHGQVTTRIIPHKSKVVSL